MAMASVVSPDCFADESEEQLGSLRRFSDCLDFFGGLAMGHGDQRCVAGSPRQVTDTECGLELG